MPAPLLIAVPDYYKQNREAHTFSEFTDLFTAEHGPLGLWELASHETIPEKDAKAIWRDRLVEAARKAHDPSNPLMPVVRVGDDDYRIDCRALKVTDRVRRLRMRTFCKNIISDTGATAMLKNAWNSAGSAVSIFNQLAITPGSGSTTLTVALTNGQTGVTSLSVQAVPASIASGTTLTIGFGTGQTQNVVTNGSTAAQATSITVNSFTANAAYAIGSNVVPVPTTSDNPSSLTSAVYSGALSSGAFAFTGTGAGNRQVTISYTYGTGSTAGNYTDTWTVNTNPVSGTGQTASHLINMPQPINSTTALTASVVEKV